MNLQDAVDIIRRRYPTGGVRPVVLRHPSQPHIALI